MVYTSCGKASCRLRNGPHRRGARIVKYLKQSEIARCTGACAKRGETARSGAREPFLEPFSAAFSAEAVESSRRGDRAVARPPGRRPPPLTSGRHLRTEARPRRSALDPEAAPAAQHTATCSPVSCSAPPPPPRERRRRLAKSLADQRLTGSVTAFSASLWKTRRPGRLHAVDAGTNAICLSADKKRLA